MNHELADDEGMVVLTQKGENENLIKNIFRVMEGNKRSFTLTKTQGNDRIAAWSLPPNFVVCKYPKMDVTDFNNDFLNDLLKNINQEQKKVFLLGDFNVDLILMITTMNINQQMNF